MFEGLIESNIDTYDNKKVYYFKSANLFRDKKTIVFNYGLACSHYHFEHQINFLKGQYNIIAHDYRGHYKSSSEENYSDLTFQNICLDLNFILEKEKIDQVILIGHSMGVNASLEFSKRFKNKVLGQVLISGTVQPVFGTMFNSNIIEYVGPFLKSIFKKFPNAVKGFWGHTKHNPLIRTIIHRGGFNFQNVSEEFISLYLSKIDELGPDIFMQMLEQMNEHDIIGHINSMNTKTLIIGGDCDKVIPNYNQRIIQNSIKGSELFIVKNGSHVPQVDFPNFINQRIKIFLEDLVKD